jgi:RHS repeat-associated protein
MRAAMRGEGSRVLRWLAALVVGLCPAVSTAQTTIEFYHLDAGGNVVAVTDWAGAIVESHDYDAFGQEVGAEGGSQPKRFAGKERDNETGWDYFGARYYGSKIGRFTTTDPVYTWQENLLDPQRWNRYAYARNNPLRYVDPDGKAIWDTLGGWANAVGSNFFLGLGRMDSYHPDFAQGQAMGDKFSLGLSVVEMSVASGGSAVLALPSGGTVVIPAAALGAHSMGQAAAATFNLSKNVGDAGGPKVGSQAGPGAGKRATPAQRQEALGENQGRCVFCGDPAREADHAVPKSRGGDTTTGPSGNLQPTCQHCNRQKGAKTSQEYVEWKGRQE